MKQKIISMLMAVVIALTTVDVSVFAVEKSTSALNMGSIVEGNRTLSEGEEFDEELNVQEKADADDLEIMEKTYVQKIGIEDIDETNTTEKKLQIVKQEETKGTDYIESTEATVIASGKCGTNQNWKLTTDSEGILLTISGSGDMYDFYENGNDIRPDVWDIVKTINYPWAEYSEQITRVVIEEGVTSIGDLAFACCYYLNEVTIPQTVVDIGKAAFAKTNIITIALPENISRIKEHAFVGSKIKNISIPDSVTVIERRAFCESKLESVTWGNSLQEIGEQAFMSCNISSLTLPESLRIIGQSAFANCWNISYVYLGKNISSIDCGEFSGSIELKEFHVSPENNYFTTIDGILFSKDKKTLIRCPQGVDGVYCVPEGTENIANQAFEQYAGGKETIVRGGITEITLPDTLKNIGEYAFADCQNLMNVQMTDSVQSIGKGCFSGTGFVYIRLSENILEIPERAFHWANVEEIEVSKNLRSIGDYAFEGELKTLHTKDINESGVVIPDKVESIGKKAFNYCYMESVIVPGSVKDIGAGVFYGCSNLKEATLREGIATVPQYMFYRCTSLEKVTLPKTLETIETGGFKGCTALEELYIYSNEAPSVDVSALQDNDGTNLTPTVYVPEDAKGYEEAPWSEFEIEYILMEEISYSVVFNGNGAESGHVVSLNNLQKDIEYTLPQNEFVRMGYVFTEWNTKKDGSGISYLPGERMRNLATENGAIVTLFAQWSEIDCGEVLKEDIPLDGVIPEGLWTVGIKDLEYNGTKQIQEFRVYDGKVMLVQGKDYTVTIRNNRNAYIVEEGAVGFSEKKAPQVVIKMKGDYAGTKILYFKIYPVSMNDETIKVNDIHVTFNGKKQTPVPEIMWKGKKLTAKDYTVKEYDAAKKDKNTFKGSATETTEKTLTLEGKGNFTGTRSIKLVIGKKGTELSINKMKVKGLLKKVNWNEDEAKSAEGITLSGFKVLNGNVELVAGTDYTVSYENNKEAGTATLVIRGTGNINETGISYHGIKRVNFNIVGIAMSGIVVNNLSKAGYAFTGKEIKPIELSAEENGGIAVNVTLKKSGEKVPADAYEVVYDKHTDKGTATMNFIGKPEKGYTGSKKVTFKIVATNLDSTYKVKLLGEGVEEVVKENGSVNYKAAYTAGGTTPEVEVHNEEGKLLIPGIDYAVSYKNNKAIAGITVAKVPTVVIKGKGNYAGNIEQKFSIVAKIVEEGSEVVTVNVQDKVFKAGMTGWKQNFKVLDKNGKALGKNDFEKNAVYMVEKVPEDCDIAKGTILNDNPMELPVGSVVKVIVVLKGNNYSGSVSGMYRILHSGHDISKAGIKLVPQQYTGQPIVIDGDEDIVMATLKADKDTIYTLHLEDGGSRKANMEVVEGSYVKNINKGTAKVTFRGINGFGGEKTVTFKIGQRSIIDNWFTKLIELLNK